MEPTTSPGRAPTNFRPIDSRDDYDGNFVFLPPPNALSTSQEGASEQDSKERAAREKAAKSKAEKEARDRVENERLRLCAFRLFHFAQTVSDIDYCIEYAIDKLKMPAVPWEVLYRAVVTRPDHSALESIQREKMFSQLVEKFSQAALADLPAFIKTWGLVNAHPGFLSGRKDDINEIFFKANNMETQYRADHVVDGPDALFGMMKCASLEVKGANTILSRNTPGIFTPLCCSIKILGMHIYASAYIRDLTKLFGAVESKKDSPAKFADDPIARAALSQVCQRINHKPALKQTLGYVLHPGPFDLDVFGQENRLYIVDTARVLPSDDPSIPFAHLIRPEVLLRSDAQPIDPDSKGNVELDHGLKLALDWREQQMRELIESLKSGTTSFQSFQDVKEGFHSRGINFRFMGTVIDALLDDSPNSSQLNSSLSLMCVEVCKRAAGRIVFGDLVCPVLRTVTERGSFPIDDLISQALLYVTNLVIERQEAIIREAVRIYRIERESDFLQLCKAALSSQTDPAFEGLVLQHLGIEYDGTMKPRISSLTPPSSFSRDELRTIAARQEELASLSTMLEVARRCVSEYDIQEAASICLIVRRRFARRIQNQQEAELPQYSTLLCTLIEILLDCRYVSQARRAACLLGRMTTKDSLECVEYIDALILRLSQGNVVDKIRWKTLFCRLNAVYALESASDIRTEIFDIEKRPRPQEFAALYAPLALAISEAYRWYRHSSTLALLWLVLTEKLAKRCYDALHVFRFSLHCRKMYLGVETNQIEDLAEETEALISMTRDAADYFYGPTHRCTLEALELIALMQRAQGKWQEALQTVLEARRRLGAAPFSTAGVAMRLRMHEFAIRSHISIPTLGLFTLSIFRHLTRLEMAVGVDSFPYYKKLALAMFHICHARHASSTVKNAFEARKAEMASDIPKPPIFDNIPANDLIRAVGLTQQLFGGLVFEGQPDPTFDEFAEIFSRHMKPWSEFALQMMSQGESLGKFALSQGEASLQWLPSAFVEMGKLADAVSLYEEILENSAANPMNLQHDDLLAMWCGYIDALWRLGLSSEAERFEEMLSSSSSEGELPSVPESNTPFAPTMPDLTDDTMEPLFSSDDEDSMFDPDAYDDALEIAEFEDEWGIESSEDESDSDDELCREQPPNDETAIEDQPDSPNIDSENEDMDCEELNAMAAAEMESGNLQEAYKLIKLSADLQLRRNDMTELHCDTLSKFDLVLSLMGDEEKAREMTALAEAADASLKLLRSFSSNA